MRNRILLVAVGIAGFLIVVGASGQGRPGAADEPRERRELSGVRDADPVHGSFWAPAGSAAVRPEVVLTPRAWSPRTRARR